MASLTVKQYDTGPPWQFTLSDSNGPINLTTATTVKIAGIGQLHAMSIGPTNCVIVNAVGGQISYAPTVTDTGTADIYNIEFAIHWSNATVQKVPNAASQNPTIEIDADLLGVSE